MRAHRAHDALAAVERGQPREAVRGALERQREGRHAAPVHPDRQRRRLHLGGLGDLAEHRLLAGMLQQAVPGRGPVAGTAQREEAGVLPGAVVLDRRRSPAALELVLGGRRSGEEPADDRELLRCREVRRAGERDLLAVEVRPRPHHGERLDRLCRRAKVRDERGVAGGELDAPVPDGHGMHDVARLDDLAAGHLDDDRLHGREPR